MKLASKVLKEVFTEVTEKGSQGFSFPRKTWVPIYPGLSAQIVLHVKTLYHQDLQNRLDFLIQNYSSEGLN